MWITTSSGVLLCTAADPRALSFLWRVFSKNANFPIKSGFTALLCILEDLTKTGVAQPEAECLHCYTWPRTMLSAFPLLLSPFSCPVAQRALLLGVIMNHGNWLCCHNSNPSAQDLTAECVTAGRSSLLKGCTLSCPGEGPVSRTAPAGSRSFPP